MAEMPGSKPYSYREHQYIQASTSNQFLSLDRYPDELILVNADATNIVYIKFDEASSTTSGLAIPPRQPMRIRLRCRQIGVICSAGTPILHVLGLAYLDERIKA